MVSARLKEVTGVAPTTPRILLLVSDFLRWRIIARLFVTSLMLFQNLFEQIISGGTSKIGLTAAARQSSQKTT